MKPHLFELDLAGHATHRGAPPCRACPCKRCPLPFGNAVHTLPDTSAAQAEHLRRIGEDDL